MEFKDSKKVGDIIEEEILKIIKRKYPEAYIDDRGKKFSDWDIFIPELNEGIEIKGDYMSQRTGNLVVEVEMYGRPSALSVTKAKYWIFVEGNRLIWIKPIEIYRFIEQRGYSRAVFTGDGDTKMKKAYLISHKDFVLHIHNNLDDIDGFIQRIPKSSPLHYDNFTKSYLKGD